MRGVRGGGEGLRRGARATGVVEAWIGKALVRGKLGDPTSAVRAFDHALKIEPDDLKALIERGEIKRRCGDRDGAHADFEHAVKSHPASADALVRRGYSWMNADRYAEALADFDMQSCTPIGERTSCGRTGVPDGVCQMASAAAYRCTVYCPSDDDCKAGSTCNAGTTPSQCAF